MSSSDITTLIEDACGMKQQINDYIESMYQRLSQPQAYQKAQRTAQATATRQYGPAIKGIAQATSQGELEARRDLLNDRLHKGWTHCELRPKDKEARELWESLLVEYTVICDALDHMGIVQTTLDRIKQIDTFVHPMEQGVLV